MSHYVITRGAERKPASKRKFTSYEEARGECVSLAGKSPGVPHYVQLNDNADVLFESMCSAGEVRRDRPTKGAPKLKVDAKQRKGRRA